MVGVIIQARMGSSRLPGKTMKDINGKPLLYYSVMRSMQSYYADKVIVATSQEKQDNLIQAWCEENNINCYRGSESDVLDRYYQCAKENNLDIIVRVTADNPFIDSKMIDFLILTLVNYGVDYVTIRNKTNTWPYGLDVEVLDMKTLKKCWEESSLDEHREHVTMYIKDSDMKFNIKELCREDDLSDVRLTVDYETDFELADKLMSTLNNKYDLNFSWQDTVEVYYDIVKDSD